MAQQWHKGNPMTATPSLVAATIANGAALSAAVELGHDYLFAIEMPAAWTAAAITFDVSYDGTTFNPLYDDTGTEVSLTVAASRYVRINDPARFFAIKKLKVRSGTVGSPVNQAAARTVNLIVLQEP
jgi:hypothetical protein